VARFRPSLARLFFILFILGPGFITANVDNDSGGIYTYAVAGSQFGYSLLWTITPIAVCLTFAHEISARMGVATGKGLSELIREQYGLRITFLLMCGMILCNVERRCFGIRRGREQHGVVRVQQIFVGSDCRASGLAARRVCRLPKAGEDIVFLSFLYIAYIITVFLARPDWLQASKYVVRLPRVSELKDASYLYLSVGMIGATIAPWQQFYLQASIVHEGTPKSDLKYSQIDAIVGSLFSVMIAAFIVIACAATLFVHGHREIRDAADAVQSLRPLGGDMPIFCLRSDFSTRPCLPPLSCRSRLRIPHVKRWDSSLG